MTKSHFASCAWMAVAVITDHSWETRGDDDKAPDAFRWGQSLRSSLRLGTVGRSVRPSEYRSSVA
eukprot:7501994-Pyramimonas_sp.AAC.1